MRACQRACELSEGASGCTSGEGASGEGASGEGASGEGASSEGASSEDLFSSSHSQHSVLPARSIPLLVEHREAQGYLQERVAAKHTMLSMTAEMWSDSIAPFFPRLVRLVTVSTANRLSKNTFTPANTFVGNSVPPKAARGEKIPPRAKSPQQTEGARYSKGLRFRITPLLNENRRSPSPL